ncbi:MAG: hypothetical protein LBS11_12490 [Oscillospiraceae bacterium]|jgi:hypothetical protein|nr:hypothetical protein [Oscillospiraceae bacterium]
MQPTKHGFIGAFTRDGYVVFDPEPLLGGNEPRRLRVRGGSARTRAAAMDALARRITEQDREADLLHDVLDPDAVVGIVCPSLALAVASAGAGDPCLNIGQPDVCVDMDEALRSVHSGVYPEVVRALDAEASSYESRVVRYMEAAAPLRADAGDEYSRVLDRAALDRMLEPWMESIMAYRPESGGGVESRVFVEAVTSRGLVQHLDSVLTPRLWRVSGPWGCDFHDPLAKLRDAALSRGLDVMCAMEYCQPDRLAHLLIPELGLFVTSEVSVHALAGAAQRTIDLRLAMPAAETFSQHTLRALAYDELMVEQLMEKAAYALDLSRLTRQRIDRMVEERVDEQVVALMVNAALAALEGAVTGQPRQEAYA